MRPLLSTLALLLSLSATAQLTTTDIPRFYALLDSLPTSTTTADSLAAIQRLYLDPGSEGLRLFDKARDLSPERLLDAIRAYPRYYASVRADALAIDTDRDSIQASLEAVQRVLPDFDIPAVTIAFGIMNTGGTVADGHILLGAGMISAGPDADSTELSPWHRSNVLLAPGQTRDIRALVAHEAVHTRQRSAWPWAGLEAAVLHEGIADFVVIDLLGFPADARHHRYGAAHECALWQEFQTHCERPKDEVLTQWLYGGNDLPPGRPADLGYFLGRRIAAAYYAQANDKQRALDILMKPRRYGQVLRESGYDGDCPE